MDPRMRKLLGVGLLFALGCALSGCYYYAPPPAYYGYGYYPYYSGYTPYYGAPYYAAPYYGTAPYGQSAGADVPPPPPNQPPPPPR